MNELVRAQDKIGKFDSLIILKDGRVAAVNKKRLYETPFFLLTDPPNNTVAVPSSGTSTESAMRVSAEGPLQLTQFGAKDLTGASFEIATIPILVRLYMRDGSGSVPMSNVPIHINTIFGSGGQMYPLPEGLYIDEDRSMMIDFTNNNESDGYNLRVCAVGAKYTQLQQDPTLARVKERLKSSQMLSKPQFYGINDGVAVVPPFSELSFQIEIQNDQNFELHQLSAVSTGSFLLNIVDMAKGESIINAPSGANYPLPSELFVGDGRYPYRFHEPILIFGGQHFTVTLVDTSGLENSIYLTLGGVALAQRQWS